MMDGLTKARMVLVSIALIAPAGSARADFQVLGGWGWVHAAAGSSAVSDSHTGQTGGLSVSAQGGQDPQSWTVVTALRWGAAGSTSGWSIYAELVPEYDAPPGNQLSEVQGSWILRIGSTDEPFEVSNTFFAPAPALSIYDLTIGQTAYVLGGDQWFADGMLLAGHDYRLDLTGSTSLESSGLEFITQSAPTGEMVPEPASAMLGLIGWALLTWIRRR